ncbi:MAG: hypothetical protein V3W44_09910 [Dehalococcoidales bacterium]
MTAKKLTGLAMMAAVLIFTFMGDENTGVDPSGWLTWEPSQGVVAWKVYSGPNETLSDALYRTTVWVSNGEPTEIRYNALGALDGEAHVFFVGVRVRMSERHRGALELFDDDTIHKQISMV